MVTAEIKVSCLRPAKGDILVARGTVVKTGNHFHFCESEVWSNEGDESVLAAKATTIGRDRLRVARRSGSLMAPYSTLE